ncbi:MAG TPA: hypothetical protein VEQ40_13640 [Pyrinomonadaceae bacterium]|nr:hypothetical protein [Pyrinomonadaceae bacterium]
MFRKAFAIMLSAIVTFAAFGLQSIQAQTVKATEAEKARIKVQKIGVGPDARVEVKLRDNTKLKGYVSQAGGDNFTVTDSKTGTTQTVSYTDVMQVKKPGGLSTKMLVAIGAVAVAAVIIAVTVIKPVACDGGAGC